MLAQDGIPARRRARRCPWVWVLLLLCWLGLGAPAWPISLGDPLPEWAQSMQVGRQRLRGVEQYQGQEQIRAYGNQAGRVFWIQIESSADLPPDYREYLGEYQQFPVEVVAVVPLRARRLRFRQGNRGAEWQVVGMSGHFEAEALSHDLAPPELFQL